MVDISPRFIRINFMNKQQYTKIFSFLIFCFFTLAVFYSQANAHEPNTKTSKSLDTNKFSFGSVSVSSQVTRTIYITMDDNSYRPERINVKSYFLRLRMSVMLSMNLTSAKELCT